MKRCGKEHQTITFTGRKCPLCLALIHLEDALETLEKLCHQPKVRAKLFVVPKRGA